MAILEEAELLTGGTERRARRWPWIAGGLAAALIVAALWLDGWQRERSLTQVEIAYDRVIGQVEAGERQVQGIIEFIQPQQTSPTVPLRIRDELDAMVQETAGTAYREVATEEASLAGVWVLPWQGDVVAARDAASRAAEARASGLRTLALTGEATYVDRESIDRLRLDLLRALSEARGQSATG